MRAETRTNVSLRDGLFSVWFWRTGVAVWFLLGIYFGLHRQWNYFALAVIWVLASAAGWSRGENEQQFHL